RPAGNRGAGLRRGRLAADLDELHAADPALPGLVRHEARVHRAAVAGGDSCAVRPGGHRCAATAEPERARTHDAEGHQPENGDGALHRILSMAAPPATAAEVAGR